MNYSLYLSSYHQIINSAKNKAELNRITKLEDITLCDVYYTDLVFNNINSYEYNNYLSCLQIIYVLFPVIKFNKDKESFYDKDIFFCKSMAREKDCRKIISEMRFKRLMKIKDPNLMFSTMKSIIKNLKGEVDLIKVIDFVFSWGKFIANKEQDISPKMKFQTQSRFQYFL
jgi:hypothetical protein